MTDRITTITHGADGIRLTRDNGSVTRYSTPSDVAEALARATYFSADCQTLICKLRQTIGTMQRRVTDDRTGPTDEAWREYHKTLNDIANEGIPF